MSRFLLGTLPVPGHVAPMASIARALVERKHEVVWYGSNFFESKIKGTGARFVPVKSTLDYGDSDYNKYFPERAKLKDLAQIKFDFKHLFIDAIAGYMKDLQEILRDFKADVLVADPAVVAAKLIGDQTGLPWVVLNISVLGLESRDVPPFGLAMLPIYSPLGRLRNQLLNWVGGSIVFRDVQTYYDRLASQYGWEHFPFRPTVSPYLYLQPSLPAYEYPRSDLPPQLHFIGPLLPDPPAESTLPGWWDDLKATKKPVVLVTQGTIATDAEQLIAPTLQALADEDVFVIATTGGKIASQLGLQVPSNAHVEPFIPFTTLMPYVKVMITNGGYGGVTIALANGVPVITGGTTEDKAEVGNRVAYSGIGINLKTATPTAEQIKTAVKTIFADERYKQKAQKIKEEMARFSGPALAAQLLEQLAATKKPVYSGLTDELRRNGWQQAHRSQS